MKKFHEERRSEEAVSRKENQRKGAVSTPDGPGTPLAIEMRKNTNGGPGTRQVRVRLEDGRIRHYSPTEVTETGIDP